VTVLEDVLLHIEGVMDIVVVERVKQKAVKNDERLHDHMAQVEVNVGLSDSEQVRLEEVVAEAAERIHTGEHVVVDHKEVDCIRAVEVGDIATSDHRYHPQEETDGLQGA
jgi:hypothetical protein